MVKWYCDRCGVELEVRLDRGYQFSFGHRGITQQHSFSLCEPCGARIHPTFEKLFATEIAQKAREVRAYLKVNTRAHQEAIDREKTARKAARKSRRV